jgi:hypothetical protein
MANDSYCGWLRLPGRTWQPVCEGLSHDDVLADLLRHAAAVPELHTDLSVLSAGQNPNGRRFATVGTTTLFFHDAEVLVAEDVEQAAVDHAVEPLAPVP